MRTLARQHYVAIKAATKRLIEACGGVEGAAVSTRVEKSSLSLYQRVDRPDCFMPADVVADLEHFAGEPVVSSVLASLIEPAEHQSADCAERLMTITERVGHVAGEVRAARDMKSAGGSSITPAEATRIAGQAEDAIAELEALVRDMQAIEAGSVYVVRGVVA